MEGLGRVFNIVPTAADTPRISLKDAAAITFIGIKSGGDTYTIKEHTSAADSGQNLACVTTWYESTSDAGAVAWTKHAAQAAAATAVSTALVVAIHVAAVSLSDGYKYISCTSTSTGLVIAITHDLVSQRSPINLPALAV